MSKSQNALKKSSKSSKWPVLVFIIGLLVLIAGGVMLGIKLLAQPATADAEFLVSSGVWIEDGQPGVVWEFTEIGKGKLTTDNHANDYDFTWTLKDGKLTVETAWLYELSNEFDYKLDQGAKILTLTVPEDKTEVKFRAE